MFMTLMPQEFLFLWTKRARGVRAEWATWLFPYSLAWININYTVLTVAADLRRGEHIPKMQNDIGHKSKLCVLRQLRSKDGGGGWVPYCAAMPCRATPRGARSDDTFSTTAVIYARSNSAIRQRQRQKHRVGSNHLSPEL